ncbi:MAG: hypothetical protein H6765_01070 [Candidatus Peribacteria bacterium]|nr:MAG: hypothetical protein H6765_01070 [Candidatus Peribacteria bacterium]
MAPEFDATAEMKLQPWDKEKHKVMYYTTKDLIDHMWDYLLPLKAQCSTNEELALADRLEGMLFASLRALKSFKNIYRDVQTLKEDPHPVMLDIYGKYQTQLALVMRSYLMVTEKSYPQSADELLSEIESRLEGFHAQMVHELLKLNAKELHELDLDLPTLLNFNHYQYK